MEQLEVINRIRTQEQIAQKIIEEAQLRASAIIQEAKLVKRKEILKAAEEQAHKEVERIKEEFKGKTQEAITKVGEEKKQIIDKIASIASKNKDKAKNYIVDEFLKIWQLQR
jgi:vacuolar-type H+-ATPase subunit H